MCGRCSCWAPGVAVVYMATMGVDMRVCTDHKHPLAVQPLGPRWGLMWGHGVLAQQCVSCVHYHTWPTSGSRTRHHARKGSHCANSKATLLNPIPSWRPTPAYVCLSVCPAAHTAYAPAACMQLRSHANKSKAQSPVMHSRVQTTHTPWVTLTT
jgi:hypothetical protein